MSENTLHKASCHCGAVQLEIVLSNGIENPRRCDCSLCRRKGAVMSYVPLDDLSVVKGQDVLREYQFNTMVAQHYFCSVCGIYTHHKSRLNPDHYGFNVGCLDGVNPFDLGEIPTMDGVNHPSDKR